MATPQEPDFPPGHPARGDYNPNSPEAKEWARRNVNVGGERDWPVGHPKAIDTPGNMNAEPVRAGIDPAKPELEAFSGRTPEQAEAVRALNNAAALESKESEPQQPIIAPAPPAPGEAAQPVGQPGAK